MKKYLISGIAMFALAFSFAVATPAAAVFQSDIYTATSGYLMVGSGYGAKAGQSSNVIAAQTALNACVPGMALALDGKFGPLTEAKFKAFQASAGIKVDGIIGPVTADRLAACSGGTATPGATIPGCTAGAAFSSVTGQACTGSTGTGTLSGTEGDLTFDITSDSDTTIDLGDSDTVIEFEAEAEDGDVLVDRVDFLFDARPWLYFDEVNLLVDGKEVASFTDEDDFSEDGDDYRARFSGLKTVVEEDKTVEFALELKALDSMAGTRDTDTVLVWTTDSSVRFMDGSGAIMTGDGELDLVGDEVAVDFDDQFGEGDVEVTLGDDSPEDATIVLDEDARTNGVMVAEFNVEATDSDIEVTDVTVEFSSNASDVADILYKAYLYKGSTLIDSQSVTADTVVFDDVEQMIDEDDEETYSVKVDFEETDGITVDEFEVVSIEVDAENADFSAITDTLSISEVHQLVVEGLIEDFDTKSAATSTLGDDTIATFTFKFDLTAYEDDFYFDEDGSDFTVTLDNGDTTIVSTTIASTNATLTNDDSYRISKGQTRTVTLEVEVAASVTGTPESVRATIADLEYNTDSDLGGTDATLDFGAPDYQSTAKTVIDAN